jgi:nitrate/TMAO reductase-like tetraheme cytochrome c subunit
VSLQFPDRRFKLRSAAVFALALSTITLPLRGRADTQEVDESCVTCHGDADFLVTDKKLYDYFQQWKSSTHMQEGITCSDCHGGNPEAEEKEVAHDTEMAGSEKDSAVNFKNIPSTCGHCHDEIYDAYRESKHFEHLLENQEEQQGPNCVTCHGSINAVALKVTTVRKACSRCHNEEEENHPEIPDEAEGLLSSFLSIHRYYRYITIRGEQDDNAKFFKLMDPEMQRLSVTWHTFDIEDIEQRTAIVLMLMKSKREEIRNRLRKQKAEAEAN